MKIGQDLLDRMIEHALADDPDECCGLIGGKDGHARSIFPMENTAHSPLRYEMDPMEQYRVFTGIEDDGQEVVGIYHSHTRTAAYPSQTDINLAGGWPDAVYFIVSLEEPGKPYVKGFLIKGSEVTDVDLQVV